MRASRAYQGCSASTASTLGSCALLSRTSLLPLLTCLVAFSNHWNRVPLAFSKPSPRPQVSQREYTPDPIWFALRDATEDSPHRRTLHLFHTNSSSLAGAPNPLTWVDNTGAVWPALRAALTAYAPRSVALDDDGEFNYAGGLGAGELRALRTGLGEEWMARCVSVPRMLVVEFLAPRMPGQAEWFKVLMENAWAVIEEAFSARVIQPGVTTTTVCFPDLRHCPGSADGRRTSSGSYVTASSRATSRRRGRIRACPS
jgi:hypothetical protein